MATCRWKNLQWFKDKEDAGGPITHEDNVELAKCMEIRRKVRDRLERESKRNFSRECDLFRKKLDDAGGHIFGKVYLFDHEPDPNKNCVCGRRSDKYRLSIN